MLRFLRPASCWTLPLLVTVLSGLASCNGHKIHQVYYLGVFDPSEQLPPTVYRLRVRGQSSVVSSVNYAAGWVPSAFVDSIGTSIAFDPESGELTFERQGGAKEQAQLVTGRRLMLFGPEGFREAPADQRLAIIMASDPSEFFHAIDDALGQLSAAKALKATSSPEVERKITEAVLATTRDKIATDHARTELEGGN